MDGGDVRQRWAGGRNSPDKRPPLLSLSFGRRFASHESHAAFESKLMKRNLHPLCCLVVVVFMARVSLSRCLAQQAQDGPSAPLERPAEAQELAHALP